MRKFIIVFILNLFVCACYGINGRRFSTRVTLTTYNAVKSQCDGNPLITADGTKINLKKLREGKIKYVAISRNLLPYIPLGSIIHIEGYGYYEVRDTMNKRFKHYVDILQDRRKKNFKKSQIRITLIRRPIKMFKKKKKV